MSYISTVRYKDDVLVWERNNGIRECKRYKAPTYFYVEDEYGEYESIFGDKLRKLEFQSYSELYHAKQECQSSGIKMFESDISPEFRIISKNYYNKPTPKLNYTFYDIEVDYNPAIGFPRPENPYAPVNAIAIYHHWSNTMKVACVPSEKFKDITKKQLIEQMYEVAEIPEFMQSKDIIIFKQEKDLLKWFIEEIEDSDIISGWNEEFFDRPYMANRIKRTLGKTYWKKLCFDEAREPKEREVEIFGRVNQVVDLSGRIGLDYLQLYKKYKVVEQQSYKLEKISETELPELRKLEYDGTLYALYNDNFPTFVRYNLRDTEILKGLEDRLGYMQVANEMVHMAGAEFSSVLGTIKLEDCTLVNFCHHELNKIVNNVPERSNEVNHIAGAYVLDPKVGMHKNIGAVDIKSLYPNTMMSINISPETILAQFDEAEEAVDEIYNETDRQLTLRFFETDTYKTLSAKEWKQLLIKRKLAISGYGTIFSQDAMGIIPMILDRGFKQRKEYQSLKKEYAKKAEKILEKYKT